MPPCAGTLPRVGVGMCAMGPSPAIPSGLGHKYPKRAGVGVVLASFGMTTRAIFSKASQSQVVRFRIAGSQWCQSLVGLCTPQGAARCPLPKALVRSTERGGNHPMPTQFPQVPRDKQGTGKSTEPPAALPPSVPRQATRYGTASGWWALGLTCLCLLSVRHMAPGSIQQQGIFFLTWDKSTFIFPGMSVMYIDPCPQLRM